jgi:hypothetical protein
MILIFAGAGASKAVNPDQYPTTIEFFSRLPTQIQSNNLFRTAVEYLNTQNEEGHIIDIEQVLWLLNELKDFNSTVSGNSTVPGWFLTTNRFAEIAGRVDFAANQFPGVANSVTTKIDSLVSDINEVVYELYAEDPTQQELADNWLYLFKAVSDADRQVEVATTNYDVVIEEAIQLSEIAVWDGRRGGIRPTLDLAAWDLKDIDAPDRKGRLTKLHGSIDWIRGGGRIHVGFPVFQGKHDKHAIIYPGFKGVPTDPFFQQLHEYFHITLAKADLLIFIGYAFRDQYINEILQRNLGSAANVVVINPVGLTNLPFPKDRLKYIKEFFDEKSVRTLLNEVLMPFVANKKMSAVLSST